MHLIVGLGNPGKRYADTRHNMGFMLVDQLAHSLKARFCAVHPLYSVCKVQLQRQPVILLKPMTFMNRSGWAVALAVAAFRTSISQCLVAYDDMAIDLGRLRLRPRGSAGGHNGMASIIQAMDSQDFPRLRLGIGAAPEDVIDYVLSPFAEEEHAAVSRMLSRGEAAIQSWIGQGLDQAMNRYN